MADTKISALSAVTDLLAGDDYVLSRSGVSYKIDGTDLAAAIIALVPPPTGGLTLITDTLLAANANNFDFTSIPGTFTHLKLITYLRGTKSATSVQARIIFNNDTGANYDLQLHYAASNVPGASNTIGNTFLSFVDASAALSDGGAASTQEVLIPNYAATSLHKPCQATGYNPRAYSSGNEYVYNTGGIWKSTSAITRITITPDANQWATGSRATLYGMS